VLRLIIINREGELQSRIVLEDTVTKQWRGFSDLGELMSSLMHLLEEMRSDLENGDE
jgi:hypothetical protein